MTKNASLIALCGSILAVGLGMFCGSGKRAPETPAPSESAIPVEIALAARQKIAERLTYTGAVEAWRRMTIAPEIGGKVAKIHVEEGQRVVADQLLAELDTASASLQLKQAEAALAVAEANLKNTARNKERMDRLLAEKAVSDIQAEQVRLAYDAAQAQTDQAGAGVSLARHAIDVSIMRAPWPGIIASKNAQVGDIINPMMGALSPSSGVLTLADDSRIKVAVEIAPGDLARIRKGQPVLVRVSDAGTKDVNGTVTVVNSAADPYSKKFRVEVVAANPGFDLRPGTFGSVLFEVLSHDDALVVPQAAVLDGTHVFVVENGKAARRDVSLGLKTSLLVEIKQGLREGDRVIVGGNYGLRDGMPVEIKR